MSKILTDKKSQTDPMRTPTVGEVGLLLGAEW